MILALVAIALVVELVLVLLPRVRSSSSARMVDPLAAAWWIAVVLVVVVSVGQA